MSILSCVMSNVRIVGG